jgi:hypothetical protein
MFVCPEPVLVNKLIIKVKRERLLNSQRRPVSLMQAMVSKLMAEKAIEGHWQQVEYMLHGKLPPAL